MNSEHPNSGPFLMACHECDLLQRVVPLSPGGSARCVRCGAELHRYRKNTLDRTLALAVTGVILFVIANVYPFLGFRIGGQIRHSNLITGVAELYAEGLWLLATLVLMTTILVPALHLLGMLYVLLPVRLHFRLPKQTQVFRLVRLYLPWSMMEVFLLGILVAVIKLAKMATIIPGTAAYAFMVLIFVLAAMSALTDPHFIWERLGGMFMRNSWVLHGKIPPYVSCRICHLVCRRPPPPDDVNMGCPRCGAALFHRKSHSIHRTWALMIGAFIFYIPANVLPITHVVSMGKTQSDTILSGVIYFISTGMWPIALIIFVASILVPLFKLLILTGLLVSVHRKSNRRPRDRTVLYRIIESVGRWSMLDIFVVTILVALVRLGVVASIDAGPAAVFFAAVVVLTMLATMSFDPRLMWDELEMPDNGRKT